MKQITLVTENNKVIDVDVISRNNDHIRVAAPGSNAVITLTKKNQVYVGMAAGLEVVSNGVYTDE